MKKTLISIISFFLFLSPLTTTAKIDSTLNKFVLDGAEILNKKTEDYFNTNSKYLQENLNIKYYLVTISNLNNQEIDTYIAYLENTYNLEENSILILALKNNRIIKVKVGTKLSDIIPNEIINEYLNTYFSPYLKNDEWNKGLKNGYSAFLKLIYINYNINSSDIVVKDVNSFIYDYKYYFLSIILWISTILSYVICAFFKKKKVQKMDTLIFSISVFLNIIILLIAYYIEPISVLLIVVYELFLIGSNYQSIFNQKKSKNKGRKK